MYSLTQFLVGTLAACISKIFAYSFMWKHCPMLLLSIAASAVVADGNMHQHVIACFISLSQIIVFYKLISCVLNSQIMFTQWSKRLIGSYLSNDNHATYNHKKIYYAMEAAFWNLDKVRVYLVGESMNLFPKHFAYALILSKGTISRHSCHHDPISRHEGRTKCTSPSSQTFCRILSNTCELRLVSLYRNVTGKPTNTSRSFLYRLLSLKYQNQFRSWIYLPKQIHTVLNLKLESDARIQNHNPIYVSFVRNKNKN